MNSGLTTAVIVGGSFASAVGTLVLIAYLLRRRGRPGANWFLVQLGFQAAFCGLYGAALLTGDPASREALEVASWAALAWAGPLFFAFALEYTGRASVRRPAVAVPLVIVPVLVTLASVVPGGRDLLWTGFRVVHHGGIVGASYAFGPLSYLNILVLIGTTATGFFMLLETVVNYGPLYRREAIAVALSPLPPGLALLAWTVGLSPIMGVNLTALFFLPHVVLDGYAFVNTSMFESDPTTLRAAERTALEDLEAPVIVLDEGRRVVDVNHAAVPLFEAARDDVVGAPLAAVTSVDTADLSDGDVVALTVEGKRREYLIVVSPLTDPRGRRVGSTVVFQDITAERRRQQRLEVLNRVLRHNLRNEISVIRGYAETIESTPDADEVAEWASRVAAASGRLASIGEKARDVDRILDREPSADAVNLRELLADVRDEHAEAFPAASVELDAPDGVDDRVEADAELVRAVVSNLVENALVHAETDAPRVVVALREDGPDAVEVAVSDDGPGIPSGELAPLQAGTEDALTHGSGIGLWIAKWASRRLGGALSFETDEGGTTVALSLPREASAAVEGRIAETAVHDD